MKKRLALIMLIVIIAAGVLLFSFMREKEYSQAFVPLIPRNDNSQSVGKDIITARGDWGYPPFEYINDKGEPDGFNIDILTAIAETMNLNIRISLGPWDEVRSELEQGKIDILAGMYKTEVRDKKLDFSIPHFRASHGVFVTRDSDIRNLQDLADKRILVQEGDVAHDYLIENNIGKEIITVDEWEALLPSLNEKKGDCVVMGMVQGLRIQKEKGLKNIRILQQPLMQRPYCLAVKEGDAELLATLNEGLNLLKTSGEYDRIYQRWFGVYQEEHFFDNSIFRIMTIGILILSCILILSMLWSYFLRKQVRRQTAELRKTMENLEEAYNVKNRFLASVSHELRTPLHGIIGMISLMEDTELHNEQEMILSKMKTSSNQLFRVISDLIDSTRLNSGKYSIKKGRFTLAEIEEWVSPLLRKSAEEANLDFFFSVENEDTPLICDKERISQIIMNLSDNAIKNTPSGSVTVELKYRKNVELLQIFVIDTGTGIPEEKQREIFSPFTQLDTEEGGTSSGLGLGLSIVQSITQLLEGKIEVESEYGKGTTFAVEIPAQKAEKNTKEFSHAGNLEKIADDQNLKVLIAEDEGINKLYLEQLLRKRGWKTEAVKTGMEALSVTEEQEFDIILMDIGMPEMNGLEASRKLRERENEEERKPTFIIALTAHADAHSREECFQAGMDGFVSKPFREHMLLKEIERLLKNAAIPSFENPKTK